MKLLLATVTAIALLGVAVTGCGGGGGDSSSASTADGSTSPGSAGDDAVAAADQACAEANREIAALGTPDNNAALIEYLTRTEEIVDRLHAEVAGLQGSPAVAEYAQALSGSVGVLGEMSNAARSRNPDGVRELSKELQKLKVGEVAEKAGLEACAEAPGVGA